MEIIIVIAGIIILVQANEIKRYAKEHGGNENGNN